MAFTSFTRNYHPVAVTSQVALNNVIDTVPSKIDVVGGTVSYSGKYTLHTFTASGTLLVEDDGRMEVFLWGAGGAGGCPSGWGYGSVGGAGGAAYGMLKVNPGIYNIIVGGPGIIHSTTSAVGGGGIACTNGTDNTYGSGGGGYSGIFKSSIITQANAIIIAGGGGGGGSSRAGTGNVGGAGGGLIGQYGASPYNGKSLYRGNPGTQTAAGANSSCDSATLSGYQGALQGGSCRINSYGGAGGGGYFGGSAGGYSEANTMAGGGGGSGFINSNFVKKGLLYTGVGTTPGNSNNSLRGFYGNAGIASTNGVGGLVIIRHLT